MFLSWREERLEGMAVSMDMLVVDRRGFVVGGGV